jgi:hypothetical protein
VWATEETWISNRISVYLQYDLHNIVHKILALLCLSHTRILELLIEPGILEVGISGSLCGSSSISSFSSFLCFLGFNLNDFSSVGSLRISSSIE